MTFPTICFRPTQVADLPFVISAEQHADNAPYVNQWSQQRHESAIVAPDFGHFIVEFTGNNALSINRPSINAPPVAVGYLIVSGLQDQNEVLLLNRIVIVQKSKGYGRQALRQLKVFTFEQLGFHRLYMDVIASNQRAKALYLSEGFVIEGTLREAYKTDSGYEDMLMLSMLSTEVDPIK